MHVEGVLLDAGDALGEPPLLVVGAAVGEHPCRRRCRRHPRRLVRWIWSASAAAPGLGLDLSRVGCPPGVGLAWIGAGVCVLLSVRRAYFYLFSFSDLFLWFDHRSGSDELTRRCGDG